MSLVEAIRRTSLIPAQILEESVPQMRSKGRLQVGADADIVVFDLATVQDNATFTEPAQHSTGFRHVLVKGTPITGDFAFRTALAGIVYVLRTGVAWRRLRDWTEAHVWPRLHAALLTELRREDLVDLDDGAVDGSHIRALKGGNHVGPSPVDRGRPGSKHHLIVDRPATRHDVGRALTGSEPYQRPAHHKVGTNPDELVKQQAQGFLELACGIICLRRLRTAF